VTKPPQPDVGPSVRTLLVSELAQPRPSVREIDATEHLTPARRRRVGIRLPDDSYSNGINRLPQISNASLTTRATNRRRKRQWPRVAGNGAVGNDVFGSRLEIVTGLSGSPDMQIER